MPNGTDDLLSDVRTVARSYFPDGMSPAHDWFHVRRVESNAERLLAARPDADGRVVRLAVLLHDVGRAREDRGEIDDHAEWGAAESERLLRERGAAEETVAAVARAVRAHRYSGPVAPETIEAELLSDADDLDALGAVGVARCFAYGGERGSPVHDPSLPPGADSTDAGRTQFNHLHEKLLDLPERMYTGAGRELAEERADFVRTFARRFEAEVDGETGAGPADDR